MVGGYGNDGVDVVPLLSAQCAMVVGEADNQFWWSECGAIAGYCRVPF